MRGGLGVLVGDHLLLARPGRVRSVVLAGSAGGALAVDDGGGRVSVVAPDGGVVTVALRDGSVVARGRFEPLVPPDRPAVLDAAAAGSGRLALTGALRFPSRAGTGEEPLGLWLVDPATGERTLVSPGPSRVRRHGDLLLAYGGVVQPEIQRPQGTGLRGFTLAGASGFVLHDGASVPAHLFRGARAYLGSVGGTTGAVVDLAHARVVARPSARILPLAAAG